MENASSATPVDCIVSRCIICGLPQTKNPHPLAGTPAMLNTVGAVYGCLPCAEKRANGRREVITKLRFWLERMMDDGRTMMKTEDVLEQLKEFDELRRKAYHGSSC